MKKIYQIVFFGSLICLLSSCSDSNTVFWGETDCYSDFLFKKYTPVRMEKTLEFEWNEDAKRLWHKSIDFEIVEKSSGKPFKGIVVYKNGERCKNNILKITKADSEVVVGIEFAADAPEGNHILYLREKSLNGLDRIDKIELGEGIIVRKNNVFNPLAKWLTTSIIAILTILVVWIVLARFVINPAAKFSKVIFDYGDGERPVRMSGAYKLICTNKPVKISLFHKLFVGNVKVEVNEFWEHPVTIQSGARNRIRFSGSATYNINTEDGVPVRREPVEITNESGKTIKVQTT